MICRPSLPTGAGAPLLGILAWIFKEHLHWARWDAEGGLPPLTFTYGNPCDRNLESGSKATGPPSPLTQSCIAIA